MISQCTTLCDRFKVIAFARDTAEDILARDDLNSFMSLPEQRLWELGEDAKWGRDAETQKRAIQELGKIGTPALGVLQEVMAVTSREEIRECCRDVINGIARVPAADAAKNQPEAKVE